MKAKQNQRLIWQELGTKENKTFLLMPNEATEFLDLNEKYGLNFAFERITGQYTDDKLLITLKVNYFF